MSPTSYSKPASCWSAELVLLTGFSRLVNFSWQFCFLSPPSSRKKEKKGTEVKKSPFASSFLSIVYCFHLLWGKVFSLFLFFFSSESREIKTWARQPPTHFTEGGKGGKSENDPALPDQQEEITLPHCQIETTTPCWQEDYKFFFPDSFFEGTTPNSVGGRNGLEINLPLWNKKNGERRKKQFCPLDQFRLNLKIIIMAES